MVIMYTIQWKQQLPSIKRRLVAFLRARSHLDRVAYSRPIPTTALSQLITFNIILYSAPIATIISCVAVLISIRHARAHSVYIIIVVAYSHKFVRLICRCCLRRRRRIQRAQHSARSLMGTSSSSAVTTTTTAARPANLTGACDFIGILW